MIEQWRDYGNTMAFKFWKRHPRWATLDEYKTASLEGLWQAARRFQPSKGFKFITYATWWIRQSLQRFRQDAAGIASHWEENGGNPEILQRIFRTGSLDAPRGHGEKTGSLAGTVAEKTRDPMPDFPPDFWDRVNKWLDPRQREIVRLRFVEGLTLEEAGERFGVTRERIRQLEAKIVSMLGRKVDFGDCLDQFTFTEHALVP